MPLACHNLQRTTAKTFKDIIIPDFKMILIQQGVKDKLTSNFSLI